MIISKGFANKEISEISLEKISDINNSHDLDHKEFQIIDNGNISKLVSELFKNINSKDSFSYISNLLVTSRREYKKKFHLENLIENAEQSLSKISKKEFQISQYILTNPEDEYLAISNDIHAILSNCTEFSNSEKLDFCNNQRYFMKLYLKELLIKLHKI
ncbi:MAG: hypothetical protein ACFFA4_08850 [Promethearchaeota archaeon]